MTIEQDGARLNNEPFVLYGSEASGGGWIAIERSLHVPRGAFPEALALRVRGWGNTELGEADNFVTYFFRVKAFRFGRNEVLFGASDEESLYWVERDTFRVAQAVTWEYLNQWYERYSMGEDMQYFPHPKRGPWLWELGKVKSLYALLGVPRDATFEAIRKAYRDAAFQNHPDRLPDDPEASDRFREITEAYDVLRDSVLRDAYDRFGMFGVQTKKQERENGTR